MSGGEVILYAYGAVCVCMLIFNIIYDIVQRGRESRLEKKSQKFARAVEEQLERIRQGELVEDAFLSKLRRKLNRSGNLIAFQWAFENHLPEKDEALAEFERQLQPMLLDLALVYRDRESMQAAYFAYFLGRHREKSYNQVDSVQGILVDYMKKDNLYCRINALKALYEFGAPESIVDALDLLDRSGSFMNEKILTDGLLTYTGDHERLTALLWERFDAFSVHMQLSLLNYVRYRSGGYIPQMMQIMTDERQDKELRLAAIRYFGKYVYEPARKALLAFASSRDPVDWEYAAISVSSLARYQGRDVVETLMQAMHSSNWYVRYNAAISLESHDLDYNDLTEVVGGRDRYAREMMMYRLDVRRLEQQKREVTA